MKKKKVSLNDLKPFESVTLIIWVCKGRVTCLYPLLTLIAKPCIFTQQCVWTEAG